MKIQGVQRLHGLVQRNGSSAAHRLECRAKTIGHTVCTDLRHTGVDESGDVGHGAHLPQSASPRFTGEVDAIDIIGQSAEFAEFQHSNPFRHALQSIVRPKPHVRLMRPPPAPPAAASIRRRRPLRQTFRTVIRSCRPAHRACRAGGERHDGAWPNRTPPPVWPTRNRSSPPPFAAVDRPMRPRYNRRRVPFFRVGQCFLERGGGTFSFRLLA